MVCLRSSSFGSLQRRISHPASHTSPAAKASNVCDPCAILSLPRARVRLHHTSSAPPIQLVSTLRPSGSACQHVAALRASTCRHAQAFGLRLSASWAVGVGVWCGGKHGRLGLNCWRLAPVAQGIEQRFPKPRVGGSNPSRRASFLPANCGKARMSGLASALYYTNYQVWRGAIRISREELLRYESVGDCKLSTF
jgi:hypothetical protein